jgi:hypothetical protein
MKGRSSCPPAAVVPAVSLLRVRRLDGSDRTRLDTGARGGLDVGSGLDVIPIRVPVARSTTMDTASRHGIDHNGSTKRDATPPAATCASVRIEARPPRSAAAGPPAALVSGVVALRRRAPRSSQLAAFPQRRLGAFCSAREEEEAMANGISRRDVVRATACACRGSPTRK